MHERAVVPAPGQRLRVLFFIPTLGGAGAERVLVNLLEHLDRNQFDPHLAVNRLEGAFAKRVPDDIPRHILGAQSLWTVAPKIAAKIRELKPDVVVAATGGGGVPTVLAHRLVRSRARLIVWERNVLVGSETGSKRRLLLALKKRLWPRADLVTAVGKYVEKDIQRHTGLGPEKTKVLYSPILDADFRHKAEADVDHPWYREDIPIILCVARFTAPKDHSTLLRGFAKLLERREARLVLLGKGALKQAMEEEARQLGIQECCWFAGFVDNPFAFMKRSTMLALTSLQEGVPGVVVQAMGCGLPVIGTDSPGGTGELVLNEETGLLIPMGDPDAFARAAQRLIDDPSFAQVLAERALERVGRFEVDVALEGFERSLVSNAP